MDDAKIFSCEFFPPRTEAGMEKLLIVRNQLDENMHPAFYSVTFGAGGTNRDRTLDAVDRLREDNVSVAPHISCIGSNRDQIKELIERYTHRGVTRRGSGSE
jgi:methylenetetrahydrofolate reductase (NADPH)